jgi:hypothetical protein
MTSQWARPAAWTIILLVTGFWLWFGIASAAYGAGADRTLTVAPCDHFE